MIRGETPSLKGGLAAGWRVKKEILVWGVVSSVFGILVELLESSDRRFAWVVSTLLQGSWAVLTFFVVPVILFTDAGVGGMFERSAQTFRDVWGESMTASLGIDLLSALAFVATIVAMVVLAALLGSVGGGVLLGVIFLAGVLSLFALLVARAAAHAVAKTALYEYATTGSIPDVIGDLHVQAVGRGER